MKLVLTTLVLLALLPTALAAPPPDPSGGTIGDCSYVNGPSGASIRCTDADGRTTFYAAHGSCLTGVYVWLQGAWVWVYCQP